MLQAAKKRNPGAYNIIGKVSGFGEKRISAIANGAKPTDFEAIALRPHIGG
jgi:hypothetical protein